MDNLQSPNQFGDKGDKGVNPARANGKLESPKDFSTKGDHAPEGDGGIGGKLAGPARTNKEEAAGHGDGRSAKGNDGKHGMKTSGY